jgi:hypothetical protein
VVAVERGGGDAMATRRENKDRREHVSDRDMDTQT